MLACSFPGLRGIAGVLIGGGLTSILDCSMRRAAARAVGAALTAKVSARLQTVEARGFLRSLKRCLAEAERLIAVDEGDTPVTVPWFR